MAHSNLRQLHGKLQQSLTALAFIFLPEVGGGVLNQKISGGGSMNIFWKNTLLELAPHLTVFLPWMAKGINREPTDYNTGLSSCIILTLSSSGGLWRTRLPCPLDSAITLSASCQNVLVY